MFAFSGKASQLSKYEPIASTSSESLSSTKATACGLPMETQVNAKVP